MLFIIKVVIIMILTDLKIILQDQVIQSSFKGMINLDNLINQNLN